jgi:uncharacterized repeat protein (TIGR03803 family)
MCQRRKRGIMENPSLWKKACFVLVLYAATGVASPAQTFTTLYSFDNSDGAYPVAPLVQATDGNLYGTTSSGGANDGGTFFKIAPSGRLTTLYSFCSQSGCVDGENPQAALIEAPNGDLYGTTSGGGANGDYGTVFKITPGGKLTTLYSFCSQSGCADGANPYAGVIQDAEGNLYGTTQQGGEDPQLSCLAFSFNGCGVMFKLDTAGEETVLHSFVGNPNDGGNPFAGLIQSSDGNVYGTTYDGGEYNGGTVFEMTQMGELKTLSLGCVGYMCGAPISPVAALVEGADGIFYGTTEAGACIGCDGAVFQITTTGGLKTLYGFDFNLHEGCTFPSNPGAIPTAGLIRAAGGDLYGTTTSCGANDGGTVFRITPTGTLTTLYSFCSQSGCADGGNPRAGLVQDTNGTFYGTTKSGGANGDGTVFSLSIDLFPFVKTLPAAGKVGEEVRILGTNLDSAKGVAFNGTGAQFKIVSSNLIVADVPAGATTGEIEVTFQPAHYVYYSNVPFYVLP